MSILIFYANLFIWCLLDDGEVGSYRCMPSVDYDYGDIEDEPDT